MGPEGRWEVVSRVWNWRKGEEEMVRWAPRRVRVLDTVTRSIIAEVREWGSQT